MKEMKAPYSLQTVLMLVGSVSVMFILYHFQPLFFFYSGSLLALVLMLPAYYSFEKLMRKKEMTV
ncbi:hypothetical protein [Bacillus solitudinis]|uniref:hypothetical protein n=1 Tax=Bacillus solitudinis TaxID=2014074 RepID=UPI000C246A22|nr:hypothetical protein [Bacillus solitudinis]